MSVGLQQSSGQPLISELHMHVLLYHSLTIGNFDMSHPCLEISHICSLGVYCCKENYDDLCRCVCCSGGPAGVPGRPLKEHLVGSAAVQAESSGRYEIVWPLKYGRFNTANRTWMQVRSPHPFGTRPRAIKQICQNLSRYHMFLLDYLLAASALCTCCSL